MGKGAVHKRRPCRADQRSSVPTMSACHADRVWRQGAASFGGNGGESWLALAIRRRMGAEVPRSSLSTTALPRSPPPSLMRYG